MIFHIRFFTKEQPKALVKREKFDILGIREANEERHIIPCFNQKNIVANNVYLVEKIP